MAFNPDDEDDDEQNAALEALSPQDISEGNQAIEEYEKNNPDEDLAKTAATLETPATSTSAPKAPYMQNNSQALLNSLMQSNPSTQPGFMDIYNGFKTGGLSGGMAKVIDYLNSPEGKEIVGGLISKQNPYAGAYMVDKAEQQKQMMAQANMMSLNDKMKLATELVTKGDDRSIEMAKMLIGQDQFQKTFGQKNQEIANEKAKTNIQQQQADTEQQRLAVEQQRAATEEKKANQDLNQTPVDKFLEIYKGKISPEDAATLQNAAKTGTQGNYSIKRSVAGTLLPGGYSFKVAPNQPQSAGQTSTGNRFTIRPVAPPPEQM